MAKVMTRNNYLFGLFCVLLMLFWLGLESNAFARAGGGRSSGSRGFSSGGSFSRSPAQTPSSPQQRDYQQQRPQSPSSPGGAGRSFLSGMAGGLMGGLIGGMLFRSLGFAGDGGLGGGFGFGDIFLIIILLGIIYFLFKWFRARQSMQRQSMQMSAAGAGPTSYSFPGPSPGPVFTTPKVDEPVAPGEAAGLRHIQEMDSSFSADAFKELVQDIFFKVQGGFGQRNLEGTRRLMTPAMFDVLAQDVNKLKSQKKINRLENISVRQVEIVDAGQDRGEEVITVKFHANLLDYVTDEANGQVLSGSATDPVKFVEYWTFARNVGEKNWILAGIHQEKDW
jgi:predicted lipid-binding transport protein (Tim44 family)